MSLERQREAYTFRKKREETSSSVILQLPKGNKKEKFLLFCSLAHTQTHRLESYMCINISKDFELSSTSRHISRFARWEGKKDEPFFFFFVVWVVFFVPPHPSLAFIIINPSSKVVSPGRHSPVSMLILEH